MNKKALSLLIAVVMLLAVVPVGFTFASAALPQSKTINIPKVLRGPVDDLMPFKAHRMGAIGAPIDQYENLIGFTFNPMTPTAFREAISNAPFNPISANILLPNGTSDVPSSLPSEVFNNLYLPPVGNQGSVGSCNAWSSTYYVWTYMMNWWRNNPLPTSPKDIMNPTFTYNLINGGEDAGSLPWDAMNLISTIGAVPLSDFPFYTGGPGVDPDDYAWVWPNYTQWVEASHNSGTEDMYWWQYYEPGTPQLYQIPGQWYYLDFTNDTQWKYAKALLAKGYIFQTTINVLPSFNFLGQPGQLLGYLNFYAYYANKYAKEYWTNGSYASWTVKDLLDTALQDYNIWAAVVYGEDSDTLEEKVKEGGLSRDIIENVLTNKLGIDLYEPVYLAAAQLEDAVNQSFISNESWWNNATFYMSAYSANGEKWLLNNGFDALFALANFEWMIHYIPIQKYLAGRAPYLNFNNYYYMWQGGHAVTVVGYDDTVQTPDGKGALIMVNSWGTNWGRNGYWYFSYDAVRNAGAYYNTTVDGVFPVEFQIEWPVSWGGGSGFVYVPKAANYTPDLMAVVGIKHPVRGEVIDGVYGDTQFVEAGIPVTLSINGTPVWNHSFLDFWNDYYWGDITNETTAADLPQNHPFPDSPMAFDISGAIPYIVYYLQQTGSAPRYITMTVSLHDLLKDNLTGTVYKIGFDYPNVMEGVSTDPNIAIPDGGSVDVNFTFPIVDYDPFHTPSNNASVNFGNFDVAVHSIIPLIGAYVVIDGKAYQLSEENAGYYFYGTGIDQKLSLPAGTYNYTVIAVYPNGKEVALPTRTVTIKEPVVYIQSPESTIYNVSTIKLTARVVDVVNVTSVVARIGDKTIPLAYNNTTGLYEGTINLPNGNYHLTMIAEDIANNTGTAQVNFVVHTEAKITKVEVNNETNVTVGVVGGSASVTAEKDTIVANVSTNSGQVTVEVPVVNNVPSVSVDVSAINAVVSGSSNVSLVAGWNATVEDASVTKEKVSSKGNTETYSVTLKADVKIGENGVAVLALRNINISKIYVIKNGQKVQLTTDKSNPLGYYYIEGNVVFVVLKEDPTIEAYGTEKVVLQPNLGATISTLNFIGYRWYNMYSEQFKERYDEAVKLGVDNATLQQAVALNETAAQYYQEALEISGGNIIMHLSDPRILAPLREAYINEMKAVKLLQQAIDELKS